MRTKLVIIIVLFVGIFTLFTTMVNAKGNIFCTKKQTITVTLKNDANIDIAKREISKLPEVRTIKITDRNKEWSKMVNRMDLPNMDNPFKNVFVIKTNKHADMTHILNKLKEMDYIESIKDETGIK